MKRTNYEGSTYTHCFLPTPALSLMPHTVFSKRFPTDTHHNTFHVPDTHSTANGAPETNTAVATKRNPHWTVIHFPAAAHCTLRQTARKVRSTLRTHASLPCILTTVGARMGAAALAASDSDVTFLPFNPKT